MTCPACEQPVSPEPIVGPLAICPACLSSLVVDGEACRRATGADTGALTDAQLAQLRKQRAQFRKQVEAQ